jgi:hypothetical protein
MNATELGARSSGLAMPQPSRAPRLSKARKNAMTYQLTAALLRNLSGHIREVRSRQAGARPYDVSVSRVVNDAQP